MVLYIKADAELPIEVLDHVGKFTGYFSGSFITCHTLTKGFRILHKIYTFVEAQQKGNRVKASSARLNLAHYSETVKLDYNKALTSFRSVVISV
jgi:hypothetical protein